MTAVDQDVLDLFARTLRDVLAADDDCTDALRAAGWRDLLEVDPRAAVSLTFRLMGEVHARAAALDDVALAAAGTGADPATVSDAAFVHPFTTGSAGAREVDGVVAVDGLAFRSPEERGAVFVLDRSEGALLATLPAEALSCSPVHGLDPSLGLVRVTGTLPAARTEHLATADLEAVVDACRRALAYELVGLASAMLSMASEYSGERVQFGQPIGAFQAVKHRLAAVFVALRSGEVVVDESWDAAPDIHLVVAAAKCLAGRSAHVASENCLQVMGAIGFTLEHELHRFIARATVLDRLYASARELRRELGGGLLARGAMARVGAP